MEAFPPPPYQSPTAPAVSSVAAAAFAAVVFAADVGALVVAASVDVAAAFRSVRHPAGEQGFQPLVSTPQPPFQSPRPSDVLPDFSVPTASVGDSGCGCETGFFPRHALNRCPVTRQDQQWGCRPSTIIRIFRSRHASVSGF